MMEGVVILRREVSLSMLVYIILCVAIAFSYFSQISCAKNFNDEDLAFRLDEELRVSELGSTREENLNCFLQFDQSVADKWTAQLGLGGNQNADEESSLLINRFKEDTAPPEDKQLIIDTRIMLDGLQTCMSNMTKNLKNPALQKCMKDLVRTEIENDGFIALPQLFDNSLPLPFLTFLDVRELTKLLYQNRTWDELSPDEIKVFQTAGEYLKKDKSGRDKVFIFDQACEWKNLAALNNREEDIEKLLGEFKQQVIRSVSLQLAHSFFNAGGLKPGTWITLYRRWAPVRLQNLKELETLLGDLKSQRFTTEELCRYATTLGNFFAEQELKILLAQTVAPLRLATGDLESKSRTKEEGLCNQGVTIECDMFRRLKKSYEEDFRCMKFFGELLSNHILYSIAEKFANIEPRITYPEMVCKSRAPPEKIAVRYCRCVGSFCTFRQVGDIKANFYKLNDGVVTKA